MIHRLAIIATIGLLTACSPDDGTGDNTDADRTNNESPALANDAAEEGMPQTQPERTVSVSDALLEDIRWTLIELRGLPVAVSDGVEQAYLELQSAENKVVGHTSCNRFFGRYELKPGNRIVFDENMGMTMMACPDMTTESLLMEAISNADNYAIKGNQLSLNKARMAPLARFSSEPQ